MISLINVGSSMTSTNDDVGLGASTLTPAELMDEVADPITALAEMARQIEVKHRAVLQGLQQTVQDAREVGDVLNRANALVPYGQWQRWVANNCTFSYESATAYRRIATHWAELPAGVPTIAEALKILSELAHPKSTDLQPASDPEVVKCPQFPNEKIASVFPEELQLQLIDSPPPAAHTSLVADQKLLMVAETIRGYRVQDVIVKRAELIALREAIDAALQRVEVAESRETQEAEVLCAR